MKELLTLTVLLLTQRSGALFEGLYQNTGKVFNAPLDADVGDPLILTPYLVDGKIEEAQQAALVDSTNFLGVTSYAGYFTVDNRFDSNLWFWFFPSADNVAKDPVVLWLSGGPGDTSLSGLFHGNGPFIVHQNESMSLRKYSWHRNHSLLFVDNPVGVGFSFTNDEDGLVDNEAKLGEDMYSALTQFFQLFPYLQKNEFFISGVSYAGKYLPAIGYTILKNNPTADLKLNLQGILIGNGWTDPINQLNSGPFVFNIGLVSANIREEINHHRDRAIEKIKEGEWLEAYNHSSHMKALITNNSQVSLYNYIKSYNITDTWIKVLNLNESRKAIHVGAVPFGDKGAGTALRFDHMKSVAPWVEELLENYRMLIYTGQVDIICGYPMVLDYLQALNFSGAEAYRNSSRAIWHVDDEPAGYVKVGGNLIELMVRDSGHLVTVDQPKWSYEMFYKFTRNLPYV